MKHSTLIRLRRVSQGLFLGLFFLLLVKTEFGGPMKAGSGDIRLPYPVSVFLEADPLAALVNALSTWTLYRGMLWSLVILIPTLVLGRFFCGWICPLGTLHHFFSSRKSESKRGKQLVESNRYKPWQRLKYYVLAAVLASALLGAGVAGVLDPISLATRSVGLALLPAADYTVNAAGRALYAADSRALKFAADAMHFVMAPLLSFKQPYFRQGFVLGFILLVLLAANLRVTRFWCRALCPLGALLGLVSRRALLGLEKSASQCDDCRRCLLACQGGDDPIPGVPWRKAECHLCLNCLDECPAHALRFRLFPEKGAIETPDLRRRATFTGIAAGVALVPALRSVPGLDTERHSRLIRPPGSLDEKNFLERCIRCGECMKVCPNNALHPTFTEAGLEGIWTPVLVSRIGYCEPSCVLCGQICPTGAIWEVTAKAKGWVEARPDAGAKPIRIGTAFYDHGRCLPWAMATECIVCEEWCPTSPKAIYLRPVEVAGADGQSRRVRQPYVDPERCVGCGACEYACPVSDRPAVYVTSIGESRSKANQIVMRRARQTAKPATGASVFPESGDVAGWTKGETRNFDANSLWEYIDGGADRYLQAGFERTMASDYRFEDRIDAAADVYVMKAPQGARKIFDRELAEGSRTLRLGDAARSYGQSLVYCKGRHLVRLTAYREDPKIAAALEQLARAIESKLP